MIDQAIILAGGLGTRLRSVVADLPKPMASVAGRPFLELAMEYWMAQGIRRFILSIGYKADVIREHFGNSFQGAEIAYATETSPLGTGGAMLFAAKSLHPCQDFLFINGDTFFEVRLADLADFHRAKEADLTLSLFRVDQNDRYGSVELNAEGRINAFHAKGEGDGRLINGGVYLIKRALLDRPGMDVSEPVSLESGLFEKWIDKGYRLYGREMVGKFIDIGIPEDYQRAQTLLDKKLWKNT